MPISKARVNWSATDPTDLIGQIRAMPESPEAFPMRIEACQRVLKLVQQEERPEQWAWLHAEIGFCSLASDDNLRQAVTHYEKALEVYTADISFKEWVSASRNLARAYKHLQHGDRAENLERAIQLQEGILKVCTLKRFPKVWAQTHVELAYLYLWRIQGDAVSNLQKALEHYQLTLKVWKRESHPVQWAKVQYNIGTTMSHLQRLGENRKMYQRQVIVHLKNAVQILTPETSFREWIDIQHNLGLAYVECRQGDRTDNLKRAIEILNEVSQVCQRANLLVEYAKAQNALGIAYLQSTHGGRSENVERAIDCFLEALKTQEQVGPPEQKALTQHNLSAAYTVRLLKDRTENLKQSILYGQAALDTIEQCKYAFSDWAMIKTGLVGALWKLAVNLGQHGHQEQAAIYLENAVGHGEAVVSILEKQPLPYRQAFACYNLANVYSDRIKQSRAQNQEQAIVYYKRALKFFTKENFPDRWANANSDLGIIYLENSESKWASGNIGKAIEHLNAALEVFEPETYPISTLRVARNLGNLYFNLYRWPGAIESYHQALEATERLYRFSVLRVSKEVEIGETTNLYRCNAYALARNCDLKGSVVAMEKGRARLLSEALQRDYADLEALKCSHPDLHQQYFQSASEITDLLRVELRTEAQLSITDLATDMRSVQQRLNQVVETIRCTPGYENFLTPSKFEEVVEAINPNAPLVYVIATSAGGLALMVQAGGVVPLWLDTLTEAALQEQLRAWGGAYGPWRDAVGAYMQAIQGTERQGLSKTQQQIHLQPFEAVLDAAHTVWLARLEATVAWLQDTIMGSIADALRAQKLPRAVLIPTGLLGLLPLHAAGAEMGEVVFTYAPNVRALAVAREGAKNIADTSTLLAIENPDGSLAFSADEVAAALATFDTPQHLSNGEATLAAVQVALSQHTVWHFSTHGWAGWNTPLEGGLLLAGGERLTLRDLLQLEGIQARLAVLSACETGIPGIELPDEVVSLPTGLLQAGVAGVVGSLWAVNDFSTALLMMRFYEAWRTEGQAPPVALHTAQRWLRESTNADFQAYFKAQLPEFGGAGALPHKVASSAYQRFTFSQDKKARPFAHPFYWAGFYYTGV